MKNARALISAGFVLLAVLGCAPSARQQEEDEKKKQLNQTVFSGAVRDEIKKSSGISDKRALVSFSHFNSDRVTAYIDYGKKQSDLGVVKSDCENLVMAIVSGLKAKGFSAQKEWLGIFVHSQTQDRPGFIRRYGTCSYDFNSGRIEFDSTR